MAEFAADAVAFVGQHRHWGAPMVLLIAFGESLALVSLLVPATTIMLALGALIGAGALDLWSCLAAAVVGAFLGDWVSYALGHHFKHGIGRVWPLSRYPAMLPRAHAFMERWGAWGVFAGRFMGPLRATVPLAAGICAMDRRRFQLANIGSAVVWALAMLLPGALGARWALDLLNRAG